MKRCGKCGEEKPRTIENFYRKVNSPDGLSYTCKVCSRAADKLRDRSASRPLRLEQQRRGDLRRRYSITAEERQLLEEFQEGVCAVCGKPCPSGKQLSLDHNHETNELRGLLCSPCNWALGKLGDSEEAIQRVLNYLQDPPMRQVRERFASAFEKVGL